MASRLRTWARRVAPPKTRALARRVALDMLDRVTTGAELLADSLRPALPPAAPPREAITVAPTVPSTPPPPPKPTLPPEDVGWIVARHVSGQLDALAETLGAEALGADRYDGEVVRKTRVASRRLRSLVELFEPWLSTKRHRRLAQNLKTITGALGPVRDLDVVLEQFGTTRDADDPLRAAAAEHVRAHLAAGVARTRKRAAKTLRSVDRDALRKDLRQAKRRIVERLTAPGDIRPALATLLDRISEDAFAKTPVPTTLDDREAVHEVRIIAKRLRYAHGWVKPAMEQAPGPRRLLKRAQRAVGDTRDLDLFIERLAQHRAELDDAGLPTLAGAIARWQDETLRKRDKADRKVLPALADLAHRNVSRLTRDALGLQT